MVNVLDNCTCRFKKSENILHVGRIYKCHCYNRNIIDYNNTIETLLMNSISFHRNEFVFLLIMNVVNSTKSLRKWGENQYFFYFSHGTLFTGFMMYRYS